MTRGTETVRLSDTAEDSCLMLVRDVRDALASAADPMNRAAAVAERLRPHLRRPGLLTDEQRRGDPDCYRQHILHVEPDGSFSMVGLVWLPGQETRIHDHLCWCATGVYEGEESESTYRLAGDGDGDELVQVGQTVHPRGATSALAPPGDIHRVRNAGDRLAISIHVYGTDITRPGTSIRRTYPQPARRDENGDSL
jgi:predicted metal-dependent enzyme (double-stranded beta helix superfamily)